MILPLSIIEIYRRHLPILFNTPYAIPYLVHVVIAATLRRRAYRFCLRLVAYAALAPPPPFTPIPATDIAPWLPALIA